jgi:hypothetical protein
LSGFLGGLCDGCFTPTGSGIVTGTPRIGTFVSSLVLFHVILAGKGFVADGAVDTLLTSVLLAMARGMTRCGEGGRAVVSLCIRARVFVFLARCRSR